MNQAAHTPNVLILGATGGIGSALARQLATLGYGLSLAARSSERLDALATELKADFERWGVEFKNFGRRWIDVKTWYVLHMITKGKKPAGGLSSALGEYKMHFEGTPHRADVDAYNTLRLFFQILKKQGAMENLIKTAKEV